MVLNYKNRARWVKKTWKVGMQLGDDGGTIAKALWIAFWKAPTLEEKASVEELGRIPNE